MIKKITLAVLLSLATASVFAETISGFSGLDAPNIGSGSVLIDFENQSNATFSSLTLNSVTFVGVDSALRTDNSFPLQYNGRGARYLDNNASDSYCCSSIIRFNFSTPTKGFAFNYGASDVTWALTAYSSANELLGSATALDIHDSNLGEYIGLRFGTSSISYAIFTGSFAYDWIFIDNFVFLSLLSNTQDSLAQSAETLRGVYSLQSVSMNNNLNNDCTLFDKNGICSSLSGTQTNAAGGGVEGTNGTLTVAYRVNNNLRIGSYLDQRLNVNNVTGVHLNNGSPGFGGFGVWSQHAEGYGTQIRVAAGYDDKDMTITRQVIESSEAGTGKTNLTSFGASIVASYAMWMPGDITFSPYAGLRYTKVKAGAYAEATSDSVAKPLTYSALTQNVTTALVGAKWTTRITDNAIAYASLGIEQDLKNNGGTYTATGVDGLTSIAFNPDISRTRRTASIGSYYNLGDTQRIGANLAWSEQAFTSIDATSLMVTYTAGF